MNELRQPIRPEEWAPWKRIKARKAAQSLLETLRERGLDPESLSKVERIFLECGMLGTDA